MELKVTIGRIVHVMWNGHDEERAAIINSVNKNSPSTVGLSVFLTDKDGVYGKSVFMLSEVPHDPNKAPGTWHWPERE